MKISSLEIRSYLKIKYIYVKKQNKTKIPIISGSNNLFLFHHKFLMMYIFIHMNHKLRYEERKKEERIVLMTRLACPLIKRSAEWQEDNQEDFIRHVEFTGRIIQLGLRVGWLSKKCVHISQPCTTKQSAIITIRQILSVYLLTTAVIYIFHLTNTMILNHWVYFKI